MDFLQVIQPFRGQPLTHQVLVSVLKGYKRPNDKIHELLAAGLLIPVRKSLYVVPDTLQPEPFLLANHIYGPSYVSMDSALSAYGLIPERVFAHTSATTKPATQCQARLGCWTSAVGVEVKSVRAVSHCVVGPGCGQIPGQKPQDSCNHSSIARAAD